MNPLAKIEERLARQPQLTAEQRAEYEKIRDREIRAAGALRTARRKDDAIVIATAERRIAKARAAADAFAAPFLANLPTAPLRILATFKGAWSGPNGTNGMHVQVCEMVLDRCEISGPKYQTVRVISDEGGPATTWARKAPSSMGVAWFAIGDQIARGDIKVLA